MWRVNKLHLSIYVSQVAHCFQSTVYSRSMLHYKRIFASFRSMGRKMVKKLLDIYDLCILIFGDVCSHLYSCCEVVYSWKISSTFKLLCGIRWD